MLAPCLCLIACPLPGQVPASSPPFSNCLPPACALLPALPPGKCLPPPLQINCLPPARAFLPAQSPSKCLPPHPLDQVPAPRLSLLACPLPCLSTLPLVWTFPPPPTPFEQVPAPCLSPVPLPEPLILPPFLQQVPAPFLSWLCSRAAARREPAMAARGARRRGLSLSGTRSPRPCHRKGAAWERPATHAAGEVATAGLRVLQVRTRTRACSHTHMQGVGPGLGQIHMHCFWCTC